MVMFDYVMATLFILSLIWVGLNHRYKFVVPKPRDRWARVSSQADFLFISGFLIPHCLLPLRDGEWQRAATASLLFGFIWLLIRRWMITWMYDWVSEK